MSLKPSQNPTQFILILTLTLTLIILPNVHQTAASPTLTLTQLRTLITLSHSLATRVSTLRLSRGDIPGARRAQLIASKLEFGLGLKSWPTLLSLGWDYVRNYAWRHAFSFRDWVGVAADVNDFMGLLSDLGRVTSDSQKAAWVAGNYRRVLTVSRSLFSRLLSVFTKSGPLREFVETLQQEMEGEFLKDCLEVGSKDLKGMVQILKDLASQYTNSDRKQEL